MIGVAGGNALVEGACQAESYETFGGVWARVNNCALGKAFPSHGISFHQTESEDMKGNPMKKRILRQGECCPQQKSYRKRCRTRRMFASAISQRLSWTILFAIFAFSLTLSSQAQIHGDPRSRQPRRVVRKEVDELLKSVRRRPDVKIHARDATGVPRSLKSKDGYLRFLGAPLDCEFHVPSITPGDSEDAARNFLKRHGRAFGIKEVGVGYKMLRINTKLDRSHVKFQQTYKNLPVFAARIIVQAHSTGGINSVSSDIMREVSSLADGTVKLSPSITPTSARNSAIRYMTKENPDIIFKSTKPILMIFDPTIVGRVGHPRLVWQTSLHSQNAGGPEELILVDGHSGEVVFHYPLIMNVMSREIYDANFTDTNGSLDRSEGGPLSDIEDVNRAYDYLGDAYSFYFEEHESAILLPYPGNPDLPLRAVVRNTGGTRWSLTHLRTYFSPGWVTDDSVGHELTHGITFSENGSQLIYENQSGAINESFSDAWGEWIDLTNSAGTDTPGVRWHIGEDLPGGFALRDMADPPNPPDNTQPSQPDRMHSPLFAPFEDNPNEGNDYGGVHVNNGVGNKLVYLLTDGDAFNGQTVTGMGISRVADLFYEVQTNLLFPAADYADLNMALAQAAINLGFSASERANIEAACLAVEIGPQQANWHPNGSLLNRLGSSYLVQGGYLRHIPDTAEYWDWFDWDAGLPWEDRWGPRHEIPISEAELNNYQYG